jgi:glycosyltransferase involved in cell wall biosynthesis
MTSEFPSTVRSYQVAETEDDADVSQTVFAKPGVSTGPVHEWGIDWRGPWEIEHDGIANATRAHVVALQAAGVPVLMRPSMSRMQTETGELYTRTERDFSETITGQLGLGGPDDPRETRFRTCRAIVHHLMPSIEAVRALLYPSVGQVFDRELLERLARSRVLFSAWEREGVAAPLASLMRRFGQVWVPCKRNARMLVDTAQLDPARVHVVPHPMPTYSNLEAIGEAKARKPWPRNEPVRLYSIGKFEERKAQDVLLEAYLRTFAPSGPEARATLAIKTSSFGRVRGFTSPTELLASLVREPEIAARGWTTDNVQRWIKIVTGFVDDIASWHAAGDVFVSTSHGEGFDLPAFDAVVARSRLVHVGFGGSEDFAPPNALQRLAGTELCPSFYRWGPTARWGSVDVAAIGEAMRLAVEEGQRGEPIDLSPFRQRAVGEHMRKLIEEIGS